MSMNQSIYFRSLSFDLSFILVIPVVAITTAYSAVYFPDYFELILFLDLSILGYHHVISTYTRIASSKLSLSQNRFLVFVLPILVLMGVILCSIMGSIWLIATIYLHWQWWHYTRQSEGISKSIRFKTKSNEAGLASLNRLVFYAVPIAAFLFMSSKGHTTFLFMPVQTLSIPSTVANVLLVLVVCLLLFWFFLQFRAFKNKDISKQHFLYLVTHHIVYLVAYVFIEDITLGWLAINIWHNAQYILFVWHFNNNKFSKGIDKSHLVISWMSQGAPLRIFLYFSICIVATFVFYGIIDFTVNYLENFTALPLVVIAYQAINFHHYVVDSLIWKMRKPSVRKNLGINETFK